MVAVEAFPGETWHGTVTFLSPTVDPATRTIRARVELPNPGLRLRPGMFATVRLSGVVRAAVVSVPRGAVLMTGQRAIVFLKAPDGRLVPRDVTTGMANDTRIEILKGLQPGDTVVSSATFLIDAESNLQSAIGGMSSMPGMDMGAPKADPVKAAPPPGQGADTVDHSAHLPAPKRPPE
jgi:RND family efflux transporter MFP subunit